MSDKQENEEFESELPELDEGWWNSVLADENAYSPETKPIHCKPCAQQAVDDSVDWKCVQNLFEKDEIILLKVDGFNRGRAACRR